MGLMHDAIVIGSGAGGAAAAWRLVSGGMKVLLLEAGPWFDPAQDYPLDRPGWERRGFPSQPGSQAEVLFGDLGGMREIDADLAAFDAAHPARISDPVRRVSANGYGHVQGVGGTTLHFVGEAHRLHADSFSLHSRTGLGVDWPLTYADLEPYYATAEDLIGVAGAGDAPRARWRSTDWGLPAHPQSPSARRLALAADALGWDWSVNPRAALSQSRDGRPACNYCGQCSRGCPIGDKGSADVTFIRAAEQTGLLDLRTDAIVTGLIRGANARISAVEVVMDGARQRIEAPLVFLAGGVVQTPRLLLSLADADEPSGLANSSGQVGRNFMETLAYVASGLAPGLRLGQRGLPQDAICWQFNAPDPAEDAAGGFRLGNATVENGLNGPIGVSTRLLSGHGAALKAAVRNSFGSALSVGAIGATIADERSYIGLSPERTDARGVALPIINSVLTDNSLLLLHRMAKAARLLLSEAGVPRVLEQYSSWDAFSTTHVFGTCRMGTTPQNSVTNAYGRCHDYENLYIADASVFPGSGGGESPALTISALALRAADCALAR